MVLKFIIVTKIEPRLLFFTLIVMKSYKMVLKLICNRETLTQIEYRSITHFHLNCHESIQNSSKTCTSKTLTQIEPRLSLLMSMVLKTCKMILKFIIVKH